MKIRRNDMDFFEKTVDAISETGKQVYGKAKDATTIVKYRNQIGTCEDVIKKNYAEIGRKYYEEHGNEAEPEFDEACRNIRNAQQGITDLEEKIKEVKGI
jgi:hypothetical protein